MKNLHMMLGAALVAVEMLSGCKTTNMRDVELRGMYVNGYSEMLALGYGRLTSIPGDKEALAAHYEEDTAWLQPNVKTHKIDIFMVGTNSASASPKIIENICKAFAEVAPTLSAKDAEVAKSVSATTPLAVVKSGGDGRKATALAKAVTDESSGCMDGSCAPTPTACTDGSCSPQ